MPRWLPNAISALRIALVPLWLWWAERCVEVHANDANARAISVLILVAIGISDVVDGYLARRFGLQSQVGATLDAVADKLAQVAVITWLALRDQAVFTAVPIWFLGLLILRDLVLLAGCQAIRMRRGTVHIVHRWHGKAASVLLFVTMLWCSARLDAAMAAWWFATLGLFVALSTAAYVYDGWRQR